MLSEEIPDLIEQRLRRLERRERWLALTCFAMAAGLGFVVWSGQVRERELRAGIRTGSVTLVDPEGMERIHLTANGAYDPPMLEFLDNAGRSRVQLVAQDGGISALMLMDEHENVRAMLSTFDGATTGLALLDSRGFLQAGFQLSDGSDPGLFLYDRTGRNLFQESRQRDTTKVRPGE